MENFVFPDEIKTKLMKMSKLINIFLCPMKLCEIAAKLYFFLLTSVSLHNFHFNYSGLKHGPVNMYGSSFSSLVSGLSGAKGLIKFKRVVFAHTLDNQMVSNSVFKVTPIIYIVRKAKLIRTQS